MSQGSLHLLLHTTNRRWVLMRLCRAIFVGLIVMLVILLAGVVLDGVVALPRSTRIAVDVLLGGFLVGGVGYLIRLAYLNRFHPRRVARLIEEQTGITNSALINAVDLRDSPTSGSKELVQHSVGAGEKTAANVAAQDVVSLRPVAKAVSWLALGLLFVGLCTGFAPRFFLGGLMRFLDPMGNRPAFSLVEFDVEIIPHEVVFGGPASINAVLSGSYLPDQADVVFVDEHSDDSANEQRVPMLTRDVNEYALELARVDEPRKFYIDTPKGRSSVFDLEVLMVPQFESITVAYQFPEYTDWPVVERRLNSQGIRALIGTTARVAVRSNLPLQSGKIQLSPLDDKVASTKTIELAVSQEDSTVAIAEFPIEFSGVGRFTITSDEGVASREPPETKVTAISDRGPLVDIVDPEPHLVVVENWNVPVTIQAADDVGISRVQLHPSVNGWAASAMNLSMLGEDRRSVSARHEFDLAELGARAGDVITYYASAYDNHPAPAKFTDTLRYVIQVISQDDYVELARRRYRMEELDQEIKALREKLGKLDLKRAELAKEMRELEDKLASGEQLSQADQQRLEELRRRLADFAKQTEELARQMQERAEQPELYDVERPYTESLEELAEQLEQQSQDAAELNRQLERLDRETASDENRQQAAKRMKEFRERYGQAPALKNELQDSEKNAEMMEKADNMLSAADRLRNVILEQRELADRMAEYRNIQKPTPDQQQRVDQMAKQQELLREELGETMRELREAAEQAKEDLPITASDAHKLCDKIGELGIEADQHTASQAARDGQGRQAHDAADAAAEKLESLMSDCPNGQATSGELGDCGLSIPREGISRTLDQLSQGRRLSGLKPGQGQTGRVGRGQRGSQGRFVMRGPHIPSEGQTSGVTGRMTRQKENGQGVSGTNPWNAEPAESLVVGAAAGSANAAGNLQGVPVGYRDQAEAYFERLAEEEPK